MLSYSTVDAHTLELLKALILDLYCRKYPENSVFRALLSLSYFDDADTQMMPVMFADGSWKDIKACLSEVVKNFQ